MKKIITLLSIGISYIALAALNLSCEVSEPERFYNDKAAPPKSAIFTLDRLQGGEVTAGNINILIDTAGINFPVWHMTLYIADSPYTKSWSAWSYPFTFEVDTRELTDGLHSLEVRVYDMNPSHGMLNMHMPASLYISGKITINNQPPVPTEILSVDFNEQDVPVISWKNKEIKNFHAYIIYRGSVSSWEDYNYEQYWTPVDTVYDQSVVSFEDNSIVVPYGKTLYYRIKTYTSIDGPGALSEEKHNTLGAVKLPEFLSCLLSDKNSNMIYYLSSSSSDLLIRFDPQTDSVVASTGTASFYKIFQNDDGSELYGFPLNENVITVLDAGSLSYKRTISLQNYSWTAIAPGKGDEVLIGQNGGFKILDTKTEKIVKEYKDTSITTIFDLDLSPDKKHVYINAAYNDDRYYISRINVENDVPVFANRIQIEIDGLIYGFSDNNLFYEMRGGAYIPETLNVRDASTLNIVRTISNQNRRLDHALIGKNGIYLTGMNTLTSIGAQNYETVKTWSLDYGVYSICVTKDGKYLYAGSDYLKPLLKIKL